MHDLASLMRKGRTFLIPGANSCIDCEPVKQEIHNRFNLILEERVKPLIYTK